ncbi:MAG: response regulator [Acidobacteriota bacterium]
MPSDSKRILIVEDEILIAQALRLHLENMGYTVTGIVSSGEEALKVVASASPDLVLMDVRLSGPMDGITAGTQIHTRFGLPVVYLTANSDPVTIERIVKSQPYGYVSKPIHGALLRSTLSIAFQKSSLERDYRRREKYYLSTLAKLESAVFVLDAAKRTCFLNSSAMQLTDLEPGEPGSFLIDEILSFVNEAGEQIDPVGQCLMQREEIALEHVQCRTHAGKCRHVQVDVIPVLDESAGATGDGALEAIVLLLHALPLASVQDGVPEYIRVCAYCRDIMERNAEGKTVTVRFETYFQRLCGYQFTHGICPKCRDGLVLSKS